MVRKSIRRRIPQKLAQLKIKNHKLLIKMKVKLAGILFLLMIGQSLLAQQSSSTPTASEEEVLNLSKLKWSWMADKKTDSLQILFNSKSNFVHMGGTWGKEREIDIIKNGFIWYKKAEVYTATVNIFGNTAILLNEIDLVAVVGGNEVVNPFMVTEVYLKENGRWNLAQLTFSHLARPVKLSK